MKVFLDTNVLVSAVATRGLCADVLRAVLVGHDLIVSQLVLDEVRLVLRTKFGAGGDLIREFVALLQQDAALAMPGALPANTELDEADRTILGAAVAARADVFVTGDRETLNLARLGPMQILSPRGFWEKLRANHA